MESQLDVYGTESGVIIMQSTLPEELEEVGVQDLLLGESAYTVAWAMKVDEDGTLWMRKDWAFCKEPGGTAKMKITMRKGYIEVHKNTIDMRYFREFIEYKQEYLPVVLV
jgi:hypothetical protein